MPHVSNVQRQRLVAYGRYLIDHAAHIHYAEVRPMQSNHLRSWHDVMNVMQQGGYLTMDCSESVTSLFRWAGLRDPNGLNYDGSGYTGTLLQHLPHYVKVEHAHPGALLVFGDAPGVHVCMMMERNGADPLLFSHGQEAGPFAISLSAEREGHVGQRETWLDISHL